MYSYLNTFIISMTPILELRASIPIGYFSLGLSIWESMGISILGGIFASAITLWVLPRLIQFLLNFTFFKPIINWILSKTRAKHSTRFNTFGKIILVILVALPIPGSGAYMGSLVAYLFGIPYSSALKLISIGVVISALLVGLITVGVAGIWNWVF